MLHVGKKLGRESKWRLNEEEKEKDGGPEEKEGDKKTDIGLYGAQPSSHLSQLAMNECCVSFCSQFYASQASGWPSFNRCSAAVDANTVVSLLPPPVAAVRL